MDTALVWFRTNLRTQDNIALTQAIASRKRVVGVYFFDPRQFQIGNFGFKKTEKYRAQFLIETVKNLQENLRKLNISLLVYHEFPEKHITQLLKDFFISEVHSQREWTTEENEVTLAVEGAIESVPHHTYYDQFLFHPEDLPFANFDQIPPVFTQFRKKCEKEASVRKLGDPLEKQPSLNLLDIPTTIPSLADLGLESFTQDHRTAFPWKGGENSAWERLNHYFWNTKKLAYYKKTRNGLIGEDYSSKLSAWLANGAISARQIYWEVQRFEQEEVKNQDTYWLVFELLWRDYFKYISLKHRSNIFKQEGILNKEYDWKQDNTVLQTWIDGKTTYDFVNANMIEIKETGWMSNRGRQNVASFFAKEKEQDWRMGAAYFESLLIDYDVHSNYGNWMYNAGVGNDPRNRKFNIKSQQDRYDQNGKYVRSWLQNELF